MKSGKNLQKLVLPFLLFEIFGINQVLIFYQSHKGVHGLVRSSIGGAIAKARISVAGKSHDVFTSDAGDYWRMLLPGKYNITVSASGYESNSEVVEVPEVSGEARLDFTLMRDDPSTW